MLDSVHNILGSSVKECGITPLEMTAYFWSTKLRLRDYWEVVIRIC